MSFSFVGDLKARDHEKSDFKGFAGNQGTEKSIGIMDKKHCAVSLIF